MLEYGAMKLRDLPDKVFTKDYLKRLDWKFFRRHSSDVASASHIRLSRATRRRS